MYQHTHINYVIFFYVLHPPLTSTLFPYTTLFRSEQRARHGDRPGEAHAAAAVGGGHAREDVQGQRQGSCCDRDVHEEDRKSTRLNSSHVEISYAVFCLKKKKKKDDSNNNVEHKNI